MNDWAGHRAKGIMAMIVPQCESILRRLEKPPYERLVSVNITVWRRAATR